MRTVLAFCCVLLMIFPAQAQDDLPWDLPSLPILRSPTPVGSSPGDSLPTTETPEPTETLPFDDVAIDESIATMRAVMESSTPLPDSEIADLVSDTGVVWGVVKSVGEIGGLFGPFSPIVSFGMIVISVTLVTTMLRLVLPVIAVAVGVIRKAIWLVRSLLPF